MIGLNTFIVSRLEFFSVTFDAHPHSGWFICHAPSERDRLKVTNEEPLQETARVIGLIKTPGLSGGPRSFSGVIMKKQASLVIIRMWSANYIERTKEVLSWDIPMTYTVYHIRNGTVSIISFSHQNKEERHSMSQGGLMSAECYGSYANGNM